MNQLQFLLEQTGLKDREEFHQLMLQQLFRSKTAVELFFGEENLIYAHCERETHGKRYDLEITCKRSEGASKLYCELKIWSNLSTSQVKKQVNKFEKIKASDSDRLVYILFGISRWTASNFLGSPHVDSKLPIQIIDLAHWAATNDEDNYFFAPEQSPEPGYTRTQISKHETISKIAEEITAKIHPDKRPISPDDLKVVLEHYFNATWESYKWFIDRSQLPEERDKHRYVHFASRLFHIHKKIKTRYPDTYATRFYSDGNQYIHLEVEDKKNKRIPITINGLQGHLGFLIEKDHLVIQFHTPENAKLKRGSDLLKNIREALKNELGFDHLAKISNSRGKDIQYLRLTKIPLEKEKYAESALSLIEEWIGKAKKLGMKKIKNSEP